MTKIVHVQYRFKNIIANKFVKWLIILFAYYKPNYFQINVHLCAYVYTQILNIHV